MGIGDMYKAVADEEDAKRYRWLRDRADNKIMRKLMAECQASRWDALVDADIAAVNPGGENDSADAKGDELG